MKTIKRIAIVCNDTRGGVQPYVALGLGLVNAGYEVRAVAPEDLAEMFTAVGIRAATLSGSIELFLRQSAGATEGGTLASMRLAAREMPSRIRQWTMETLAACEGADLITGGVGGMVVGLSVADKLCLPFIESHLQPVGLPTGDYPGALFGGTPAWLGGFGRYLSHHLSEAAIWMPFRGAMRSARQDVLGLSGAPQAAIGQPVLYGFSRHLVQVPSRAGRERHVTGYWNLPTPHHWHPGAALEEFIARGGPLVSIGFGSMANTDPEAVTELVLGAVRDAGVRAVLLSGWGGLRAESAADDVYFADAVPHDWLFPRMQAVVHHGGAGTTGAALRAGVPAIVVPFTMDQPFWAGRVAALGVGTVPIPRQRLTRARLAAAIRVAIADSTMRQRASAYGELVRAEDGVANAVGHFNRMSARSARDLHTT
jgi:UDP:flavonoid glycosyltransferase YjiC (YdhE family)